MSPPVHAGCVARLTGDGWRGVLLTGPSGAGKSDLGLQLMARGWRLVSDDYSHIWACDGGVFACAPDRLAGRIEARGVGILAAPALPVARIALVVDGVDGEPERLPEAEVRRLCGLDLPLLRLNLRHPATAGRIHLALSARAA